MSFDKPPFGRPVTPPFFPVLPESFILPALQPVQWADIHPRDFSSNPPLGFPNNGGPTPYLTARARLSQAWINRWTIVCMLVLVKLLLSTNSLYSDLDSARSTADAACRNVEVAGSALVSVPYYVSAASNELIAQGVEKSVEALVEMLDLLIVGVEEIVIFTIDLVTGTYTCLITMAVTGSVSTVLNATESIISWVNGTLDSIATQLDSEIDSFNSALANVEKSVENVGDFFSGSSSLDWPTLLLPEVGNLTRLSIPSSINDELESIEKNLPNFEDVRNATSYTISYPFEQLRLINATLTDYSFDRSVLTVPSKEKLSFCSEDSSIDDFFDSLVSTVRTLEKMFAIVLSVIAVSSLLPMAYLELAQWRKLRKNVYVLTRTLQRTDKHIDPIDSFYVATNPLSSFVGLYLTRPLQDLHNRVLVRWAIAYVTYPPALLALTLGFASLVTALGQKHILNVVKQKTPELASNVGGFTATVATALQSKAVEWANGTNIALKDAETELNEELFGWVLHATSGLNNTLNTLVDEMMTALNDVFGGTALYTPIKDVLECLLLLKIQGIEAGLTWAHDNAHISLPRFSEDIVTSALLSSDSLMSSNGTAAQNSTMKATNAALPSDAIEGLSNDTSAAVITALGKAEEAFSRSISIELYLAAALIGVWVVICMVALLRLALLKYHDHRAIKRAEMAKNIRNAPEPADPTKFRHVLVIPRPTDISERRPYTESFISSYKE